MFDEGELVQELREPRGLALVAEVEPPHRIAHTLFPEPYLGRQRELGEVHEGSPETQTPRELVA